MSVQSLGYVVIGASDLSAWHGYATEILGMQTVADGAGGLRGRVDSRDWRIAIEPSPADDILAAGWEVAGPDALAALVGRLHAAGIAAEADAALAARRGVRGLAWCHDPCGLTTELFWGATERGERPFTSPAGISGFITGEQGLGHIVVSAHDAPAMLAFYQGVLGFGLSDHIDIQGGPRGTVPVVFLHCNQRHHSLAFAPGPPGKRLLHLMVQAASLDDVGFAQDRAARAAGGLALRLGRHANDHMISFYAYTPSGFEIEFGWGARAIDVATWLPVQHQTTSIWGHEFVGHGQPPA